MNNPLNIIFNAFLIECTDENFRVAILEFAFLNRAGALLAFECVPAGNCVSGDLLWISFFAFKNS